MGKTVRSVFGIIGVAIAVFGIVILLQAMLKPLFRPERTGEDWLCFEGGGCVRSHLGQPGIMGVPPKSLQVDAESEKQPPRLVPKHDRGD